MSNSFSEGKDIMSTGQRGLKTLVLTTFWRGRTLIFRGVWATKSALLQTFWQLRSAGYRISWTMKSLLLQTFWRVRAAIYRFSWTMKSLLLRTFWALRAFVYMCSWRLKSLLLRLFWLLRALGFRTYWFIRSLPFKVRFVLRALFYKYLFQFLLFKLLRRAATAIASRFFKIKVKILHGLKGQKYDLVPISDFTAQCPLRSVEVAPRSTLAISGPQFLGKYPFKPKAEPTVQLDMPRLEIYYLQNAAVIGGSNFIRLNGCIVHPDDFLPERDVCPAELNGIAEMNLETRSISLFSTPAKSVDKAVSLLGSCTGNYAHWLTETLPKLLLVDSVPGTEDYPLLVDAWIHPNFVKSIDLFNKNKREIIRVNRWETVQVGSLVDVTPPAYIPPEYRHFLETKQLSEPDAAEFPFSAVALDMLRNAAHRATGGIDRNAPEKLYLFRSPESCGNTRHVTNIDAIERTIKKFGYTMLDPAKLSFTEQIRVFSNAKKIISPLGAALANTIFTPLGCKVLGLSPYYYNANYYYFSNFMAALGHTMFYALGLQKNQWGHVVHKDYEIDLAAFNTAIKYIEAED